MLPACSSQTWYCCEPSAVPSSSTPLTVTVCGARQLSVVNFRLEVLTVPSAVFELWTGMFTSLPEAGCELSTTVKVALPPLSEVDSG